jgi:hypothetical protein
MRAQPWAFSGEPLPTMLADGSQSPETPMPTRLGYLLPTREKIMAGEPATEPAAAPRAAHFDDGDCSAA